VARRWLELALQTLQIQPLFPLALGRVALGPDPLTTAAMMQDVLALRGSTLSNPDPGWCLDRRSHGVWQLHRLPGFAWLREQVEAQAWAYSKPSASSSRRSALFIQRSWAGGQRRGHGGWGPITTPMPTSAPVFYLNGDGSGRGGSLRLFAPRQAERARAGGGWVSPCWTDRRQPIPLNAAGWMWPPRLDCWFCSRPATTMPSRSIKMATMCASRSASTWF